MSSKPSEPLFRYRRTKTARDITDITFGRSFTYVLIAAMLLLVAILAVASGHADLLSYISGIAVAFKW